MRLGNATTALGPLLTALAAVLLISAAAESALTITAFTGTLESTVLRSSDDDAGHVMYLLANRPMPALPAIALVGSSALREAFPLPAEMERRLREASGLDRHWLLLATSGQTMGESIALAETAALPHGSTVVLHLTAKRLSVSATDVASELNSPALPFLDDHAIRAAVSDAGAASPASPRFVRYRGWLSGYVRDRLGSERHACLSRLRRLDVRGLACLARASARPATVYRLYKYPPEPLAAGAKDSLAAILGFQSAAWRERDGSMAARLVVGLADRLRRRSVALVLLRLPSDPHALAAELLTEPLFAAFLRQTQELRIPCLDLRFGPRHFGSDDFYDLHHLLPAGRERAAGAILAALANPDSLSDMHCGS